MGRALAIGIVHGLAGSAAVALLVMTTIHDAFWAAIYLGVFGLRTIAGMMVISIGMAVPVAISSAQFTELEGAHHLRGRETGKLRIDDHLGRARRLDNLS